MTYTIQQLARIAGVTIRTLHYYDQIGLLSPTRNQANGYRRYVKDDLFKLQHINFFKEIGLSLSQIRQIIHDPNFDPIQALQDQQHLLVLKRANIQQQLNTIDTTIHALKGGETMTNQKVFASISEKQLQDYQNEAKARWGHTQAWQQSQQRTKNWTKADFDRVKRDFDVILHSLVVLIDADPQSLPVQTEIKSYWEHLNQFYDMTPEIFQGLAQMYIEDIRFKATFDRYDPKLADFMNQAMGAYVKNLESK